MKRRLFRNSIQRQFETLENRNLLTLVISEVNFNPYAPVAEFGETTDNNDDFEFIEIVNSGETDVDLVGVEFTKVFIGIDEEGIDFTFGAETLAPNERIVVVENIAAFESRYGTGIRVAGQWSGGLGNGSETLTLVDANGVTIEQMQYKSGSKWPGRASGIGASLERVDIAIDGNEPDAWQSSIEYGGSPGRENGDRTKQVVINEILAHTDLPQIDIVELFNVTDQPIDVSGWYMSDNIDSPFIFAIPDGSIIPADGYLLLDETDFNPGGGVLPTDYALSELGDELWLISAHNNGSPNRFEDQVEFGATLNGVSVGNFPNGVTRGDLQPLQELTFGEPNTAHRESNVVVSEVQYHPPGDDTNLEFIELENTTVFAMSLDGWRITGAVDVDIPVDVTIGARGVIVLVAFDPANAELAGAFRDYYQIDETVALVGPWDTDGDGNPDTLSNGGEKINLRLPVPELDTILYVGTDQVDYNDAAPWPLAADGQGASIERISTDAFGNEPTNWEGNTSNPGNQPIDINSYPTIEVGTTVDAEIGADDLFLRGAADVDVFRFTPTVSASFQFDSKGIGEFAADTFLRVFEMDGTELGFNDNASEGVTDSHLTVDLTADVEYLVTVSGTSDGARHYNPITGTGLSIGSIGTYSLSVEEDEATNLFPWQNPKFHEDVDGSGAVNPFDAIQIINALNRGEGGKLPALKPDDADFLDVTGDNFLSPFDALGVINYLNDLLKNGVAAVAKDVDLPDDRTSDWVHDVNALIPRRAILEAAAIDLLFHRDDEIKNQRDSSML